MAKEPPPDLGLLTADVGRRGVILGELLAQHRGRLVRMVQLRMHPQVRARLDASDVIQEAYLEAYRRIEEYAANPRMPFFLWLRRITGDRLLKAHRTHLDSKARDVRRQVSPGATAAPDVTAVGLADLLAASTTTPSLAASRVELKAQVAQLLSTLSDVDREVLCMRHFEELSNEEVATELGIGKHAASKRYIRALKRLRELTGEAPPH